MSMVSGTSVMDIEFLRWKKDMEKDDVEIICCEVAPDWLANYDVKINTKYTNDMHLERQRLLRDMFHALWTNVEVTVCWWRAGRIKPANLRRQERGRTSWRHEIHKTGARNKEHMSATDAHALSHHASLTSLSLLCSSA